MEHTSRTDLVDPLGAADHVLGPEDAPVVVVEYGDFECPRCKQAAPAVDLLLERFRNRVRFGYRHFAIEHAHPHALQAAQAAECAGAQGRFWEMHKLLFENQTHLELEDLRGYAERLDLDVARFTTALNDEGYLGLLRAHMASGQRSGVRASPGFFVNGRVQDVSFGIHQLLDATEAILRSRAAPSSNA